MTNEQKIRAADLLSRLVRPAALVPSADTTESIVLLALQIGLTAHDIVVRMLETVRGRRRERPQDDRRHGDP